ncbi:ap-3 complex subunit mu [Quercus suber]|uniref:Ap-3 complex subunit mu n=1 Tax=Quercus suber TaxID=58331 RepID=A0AAW0MF05_QUESU
MLLKVLTKEVFLNVFKRVYCFHEIHWTYCSHLGPSPMNMKYSCMSEQAFFVLYLRCVNSVSQLLIIILQPVIASRTHILFQVVREGITFLACMQVEMLPLMAIEALS